MVAVPETTEDNDVKHVETLRGLEGPDQWTIKYLYDRLGIIDNKTSALLRFNGVAMGFLSVLMSRILEHHQLFVRPVLLLALCLVTLLAFGFAELAAFKIFWLKFDRLADGGPAEIGRYKRNFSEITCDRERKYRSAFKVSAAASLGFFVVISWMAVPVVFGHVALK